MGEAPALVSRHESFPSWSISNRWASCLIVPTRYPPPGELSDHFLEEGGLPGPRLRDEGDRRRAVAAKPRQVQAALVRSTAVWTFRRSAPRVEDLQVLPVHDAGAGLGDEVEDLEVACADPVLHGWTHPWEYTAQRGSNPARLRATTTSQPFRWAKRWRTTRGWEKGSVGARDEGIAALDPPQPGRDRAEEAAGRVIVGDRPEAHPDERLRVRRDDEHLVEEPLQGAVHPPDQRFSLELPAPPGFAVGEKKGAPRFPAAARRTRGEETFSRTGSPHRTSNRPALLQPWPSPAAAATLAPPGARVRVRPESQDDLRSLSLVL